MWDLTSDCKHIASKSILFEIYFQAFLPNLLQSSSLRRFSSTMIATFTSVRAPLACNTSRRSLVVRAAAGHINPDIKKDNPKVVDEANVSEQTKPMVAYCRCWRSKTFPLCDGTSVLF